MIEIQNLIHKNGPLQKTLFIVSNNILDSYICHKHNTCTLYTQFLLFYEKYKKHLIEITHNKTIQKKLHNIITGPFLMSYQ